MSNRFITITAGHSNKDPGAVNGKYYESNLVVAFRNAVKKYLEDAGITVKTDGAGAVNQPLADAVKLISGSKIAVEFHMNASSNKNARGIETISLPKDKALAQKLSTVIANRMGSVLRGTGGWIDQSQSARGKLAFVSNGGLIVELGFISNETELQTYLDNYWLVAKDVAAVLIEYFNK